ncbi:expressed unknown protein [Seminavis robusta]|uniref:Uncharacterized protein n=1 Tax=Seminavis robusta TaxID=568900 RepID=A0A9N8HPP3_9STRA|nr:expressed unknown protein [Seminavis robusta]|eukprot:Sro1112_g242550.1 n/a (255) ;mRNA; r:24796-25560
MNRSTTTASNAKATTSPRFAEEGLLAIKEVERLLFFTDLKDQNANDREDGLKAVKKLDRWLSTNELVGTNHIQCISNSRSRSDMSKMSTVSSISHPTCSTLTTTHLEDQEGPCSVESLRKVMELIRAQLEASVESGRQTVKEAERLVFFTDLDDRKHHGIMTDPSETPLAKLQQMLKQMEFAFTKQLAAMGKQTSQVLQECERTVLFTDVPDESKKIGHRFFQYKKQKNKQEQNPQTTVLQELERQLLFTDVSA